MRPVLTRLWGARRAIGFYVVLLALGWIAGKFLLGVAIPEMRPMNEPLIHRIMMWALVVFIVSAAIPFVPGAEIGLTLLLVFGGQASPIVYTGMVGALLLSYGIARVVPLHVLSGLAGWLGLKRVAAFIVDLSDIPPQERPGFVSGRLTGRFGKGLMRNRYVVLAILLNMPGNSALGGGGGLAFLAGISGCYRFWPYLVSVLVAVAPVPLIFLLLGM